MQIKAFLVRNKLPLIVICGFLFIGVLLLGLLLPAPYTFRYAINRMTRQATFQCSDGIYSFTETSRGACAYHGAIAKKFKPDGTEAEPSYMCRDGSSSFAETDQGACSGHGGIDRPRRSLRLPSLHF